jgi:hypothetical protein
MGRRNYLIEGVSGAGKAAVCTELQFATTEFVLDRPVVVTADPDWTNVGSWQVAPAF